MSAAFVGFMGFLPRADEILHEDTIANRPRVPRRWLKERLNPIDNFNDRISRAILLNESDHRRPYGTLPPEANASNSGVPLPPTLQLLIASRFCSAGTFQVVAGDLVNVLQPTVYRMVKRISRLLSSTLFSDLVKFPAGMADIDAAMRDFCKIGNFPGVMGCIDCTHMRIKGPGGPNGKVYRNR